MATLATFFRKPDAWISRAAQKKEEVRAREAWSPYALRGLPGEDVFFYSKRIDNSRVVRAADPRSRAECWTAIGAACVTAVLVTVMLIPSVGGVLAGYKIEGLKAERQRLINERRVLELEESRLLSPERLEQLAIDQHLVQPSAGQVVHLDDKPEGALAKNVK